MEGLSIRSPFLLQNVERVSFVLFCKVDASGWEDSCRAIRQGPNYFVTGSQLFFLSNCKGRSINRRLSYECKWREMLTCFVHVHNDRFTSGFPISNLKWLYHFVIRKRGGMGEGREGCYFYSGMSLIFRNLEVILYV